jgi:ABC-type antimicrobial peptide transport system permease subunit
MSVGLLLIGLLSDMNSYDKFHEHHDNIYRVITKYKYLDEDENEFASTSLRAGKSIQESVPGIEKMTVLYRDLAGDFRFEKKTVPLSGFWANESFFQVFTFPMLSGDPSTALKNPFSIVLTETAARKMFDDADPLGKTVLLPGDKEDTEFAVTGVIKDVPLFSHMKFDMLISLSTREITQKDNKHEMRWDNIWNAYVYLLLPKNGDFETLQSSLTAISRKENQAINNTTIGLGLQALGDIALGKDLNNSIGMVMGTKSVWMIAVLSIIVLLSACFNYTNLSIARSFRRSREIGIRKVVGALNIHVIGQFIVEAALIALCALVASYFMFEIFKPFFFSLSSQYREMLTLNVSPKMIIYFILMAVGTGVAAGLLPALFFARVNAVKVLKNISGISGLRNVTMRKILIVAQFTISLMFIAATIIGYKHYRHVLAFDLGFDTENVLNIRLAGNNADLMRKELSEMPEVKGISTSSLITSLGNYSGTNMKYENPMDSAFVNYNFIDEHYLPLHGHSLLAGKNFSAKPGSAAESEVIVNERVLRRFNIGAMHPMQAVGESITVDGKTVQIVGVVKDFQFGKSIDKEIKEFMFRQAREPRYLNVKILSMDLPETMGKIERAWKKIDNVHPFDATFYDEQIESSYHDFSSRIKVIGSLSAFAICIAAIGLLGMVVFTTETRLKEISIRKVLGAGEGYLVFLLSKNFLILLAIAAAIALPATHFFFAKYVLDEYADGAPIAWIELFIGIAVVLVFSCAMIGSHTLRIARTNPADVLKSE